ncbi:MAG: cupin domain-containing protein [Melioribacteraceae bacterium]|nr:cupin domain-containing protein [Melioribacteraceae bacterium]
MPVFDYKNKSALKDSEVEVIDIIHLGINEVYHVKNHHEKETLLVGKGKALVKTENHIRDINKNEVEEYVRDRNELKQIIAFENSVIIRIGGKWNNKIGTRGVFQLSETDKPKNVGDPVDYERNTEFDNHFHDCDEFWILFSGSGEVVTEGNRYNVRAGDCVFTKAGDHHDFPIVHNTIEGVWFETSLVGQKREGHLWNHTHNKSA